MRLAHRHLTGIAIQNGLAYQANGGTFMGGFWRGAVVSGASALISSNIANAGIPFANTAGIFFGSIYSSGLSNILNGNNSSFNVSLGFASFDLYSGSFSHLGKKGNSFLQNLGYTFGAMANLQDAFAGTHGTKVDYRAEGGGGVPHARVYSEYGYDGDAIDISANHVEKYDDGINVWYDPGYPIGHDPKYHYDGNSGLLNGLDYAQAWAFRVVKGKHYPITQLDQNASVLSLKLTNVNGKMLARMTQNMKDGIGKWGIGKFMYGSTVWGCQSHAAQALWGVGIPTIPFNLHPLMLYAQLGARQVGIFASPSLINRR
jgi:hypothetical protein